MGISPHAAPVRNQSYEPQNGNPDRKPLWWRILEGLALVSAIAYAVLTYFMWQDSHRNFITDEQASVNIASQAMDPNTIKVGMPIEGTAIFVNDGKTTAKRILSDFRIAIQRTSEQINFEYSTPHTISRIPLMAPHNAQTIPILSEATVDSQEAQSLTKDQVDDLLSGRSYVIIYGQGTYADIFGRTHWFRYCAWRPYYSPSSYNAEACTIYNDVGDGKLPPYENKE
jgi:hypothetical protein